MAIDVQTVLNTFDSSLFLPELTAKNKRAALSEMVKLVSESGIVRDPNLLSEMLHSRESLGSTGIGNGIAVPHGRSLAIPKLVAAFARHPKGVKWEAIDGKPVHFIFLVMAPPVEQSSRYLPFLGRIVESVSSEARRKKLLKITNFEEFQEYMRDALA